jgi:hypothetical protein
MTTEILTLTACRAVAPLAPMRSLTRRIPETTVYALPNRTP